MGVPRLFKFLCDNFPEYIEYFGKQDLKTPKSVDYLYLDANGLLHGSAQEIHNYGSVKRIRDPYRKLSFEEKNNKVYEMFTDKIMFIAKNIIKPTKVLYIAIDGPAPLAKQAQQRQRRFIASNSQNSNKFQSSCITPGTVFMHELECYMTYRIRKELNFITSLQGIQIIFSPPTVPGEGEHKLMDYIRALPEKELREASHCLFGPDGDLIMLTLATHLNNMLLLREDISNPELMHLVDMGGVRNKLALFVNASNPDNVMLINRSADDITNDFILQGFFVGNDFLPKIQMFYLLEEGMGRMMNIYSRTFGHLTVNNRFNLKGFKYFLMILNGYEKQHLIDQHTRKKRIEKSELFFDKTLDKNIIFDSKKGKCDLNFDSYRIDYYSKAGIEIEKGCDSPQIKQMSIDYLKTLVWVLDYYVTGLPDWKWCYKHHYPPLMCDLLKVVQELSPEEESQLMTFDLEEPSVPFVQLLSVLPSTSKELLPKEYRKLMVSSELVDLGYYPDSFHVDYEGKLKEYQGIAILPFVDNKKVNKVYNKCTIKKYLRNELGKNMLFVYDSDYSKDYKSCYGNIRQCHVKKSYL